MHSATQTASENVLHMVSAWTGKKTGGPANIKLVWVLWKGCVGHWVHSQSWPSFCKRRSCQSWSAVTVLACTLSSLQLWAKAHLLQPERKINSSGDSTVGVIC